MLLILAIAIVYIKQMSGITYSTFERDFRFEKRLGKGNYAIVTQVQHILDQRSYAHKCIQHSSIDEISQAFNEIETNKCIDDDKIVKIIYYYTRENKKTGKYELGMIMDLCYSNLAESIKIRQKRKDFFSKSELKDFLAAMIPFFAKMQRKGYLHRDIKPDNILLVKNVFNKTQYKVGDFGFSIKLNAYSTQNIAGTMEYVSPKLLVKFKDNKVIVPGHNFKDDVYSFGKTLYELMTLEVNAPIDAKKLVQCANRYGAEYCGLVSLMLKEAEIERPDFIYLENYATRKELIFQNESEISKNNFLSISTVNGASSKQRLNMSKVEKKYSKSKDKAADITKTRRKEFDVDNNQVTKAESITSPKPNLKTPIVGEEINKKKVIAYNEMIRSLTVCESCLFIGSEGKLGIMLLANEKIIKLKHDLALTITCIKVDPAKRYLFFGTLEGKLYTIEITEFKKLIIDNNENFKKRNQIELPFSQVKYKVIDVSMGISTFDCYYLDDRKDPSFVVGHYKGQITFINGDSKTAQYSYAFGESSITQIVFYQGCIYSSGSNGVFKRELNLSTGQCWSPKEGETCKSYQQVIHEKNTIYKYHMMLVGFQIIDKCKLNESIPKESHKYLAIIISYDGLAHFITREFKLEKMVRISYFSIPTVSFEPSSFVDIGANGYLVDSEGGVYSEQGKLIDKSEQKLVGCVEGHLSQLYLGSYTKNITIISRREAVRID